MRGIFQALAKGSFANLHICGEVIGVNVTAFVFEVQADRVVANLLCLKSRVSQAVAEFDILPAVTHAFIKSVYPERVGFKAGSIVTVPGAFGGGEIITKPSQKFILRQFQQLVVFGDSVRLEPSKGKTFTGLNPLRGDGMTGLHGELEVPAREEKTFLRPGFVNRYEILPGDAVSVG